ncbi:single-stranded DNA-binding protein [Corynebacterium tapiri]|uniref:Single-stranded DNA-binding protein n=1 Tax=Corynebacterium tapiri TaxID=1448266 RepID=A0A5C4U186_9CORY|nr:single-stranded DNA-binding protein [Corynebacterium tapiri]TNL94870.1 single-stranded DNA-binding protein [Corynebacterium tapiri]
MPNYPITVIGNLTDNPDCKTVSTGSPKTSIRIAAHRSVRDPNADSGWRDTDHLFLTGEMWGQLALNAAESLRKGMSVIASGRLVVQEWESDDKEGEKKRNQRMLFKIERIGLDLNRYVVASRRTDEIEHNVDGLQAPARPTLATTTTFTQNTPREPALAGVGAGRSGGSEESTEEGGR